jgi:dCMP deaminase
MEHCVHPHVEGPCQVAVHAEAGAISFAARHGIRTLGADLYCTHLPCKKCAELIINAGIRRVVFMEEYRDKSGLVLLNQSNIIVEQFYL